MSTRFCWICTYVTSYNAHRFYSIPSMSDSIYWFCVVSFSFLIVNMRATTTRKRRAIINGLFLSPIVHMWLIHMYGMRFYFSSSPPSFILYKRKPCESGSKSFFKQIWNSISIPPPKSKCHSSRRLSRCSNNRKVRHWHLLYVLISIAWTRWSVNYSDVRLQLIRRKKKKKTRWFDKKGVTVIDGQYMSRKWIMRYYLSFI